MLETNGRNGATIRGMSRSNADNIASLSPEQRIVLIGDLWDSLADADLILTAPQFAELTRRFDAFEADPSQAVAWSDLKSELEKRSP